MSVPNPGARPASAVELLPWLVPITDDVVVCKDGALLASWEFTGADLDGADAALLAELSSAVDSFGERLRDKPITLWWTVRRERTEAYPGGEFRNPVGQYLDDIQRERLLAEAAYRNRHYLSIAWLPPEGAATMADRISALVAEDVPIMKALWMGLRASLASHDGYAFRATEVDQALREFESMIPSIEAVLYPVAPRRLSGDAFIGFLWGMANPGLGTPAKSWDHRSLLDGLLPERPVSVARESVRFGDGEDAVYATAISLRAPPARTAWAAVEGLLAVNCEMVLSQCFRVMGTAELAKHADALRRTLEISKLNVKGLISAAMNRGVSHSAHVDQSKAEAAHLAAAAKQSAMAGTDVFGYHNLTVMPLSRDRDHLESTTVALLKALYASQYAGAVRESLHLEASFATTLPGSWRRCERWLVLSHRNATDMAPLTGVSDGEFRNEHLTRQLGTPCDALLTFQTPYLTPFYFSFHHGALGHAAVVGPPRSGKSIGMNLAIASWNKYRRSRAIIFDKDASCKIPTILQDGVHIDLKESASVRLNPLSLLRHTEHWTWVQEWVEGLIGSRGYQVTTEDTIALRKAIERTATREDRTLLTLGHLATQLPRHLSNELAPWVRGDGQSQKDGAYAAYFDNDVDDLDLSAPLTCIEMNEIMKIPRVARAFLEYAFCRINLLLDQGTSASGPFPTLIYIEEAWHLLADEAGSEGPVSAKGAFTAKLLEWLKAFAKKNCVVVLTTQSLEDLAALPPQVFAAVRDSIPTKLFLPNALAMSDTAYPIYKQRFGLTDAQIEALSRATPREDYLIVKPGVSRLGKLKLDPRQVAVLRSDALAQSTFKRFYDPSQPVEAWRGKYLAAMLED